MAVALVVMIGVSIYISMNTAYYTLDHSRMYFTGRIILRITISMWFALLTR